MAMFFHRSNKSAPHGKSSQSYRPRIEPLETRLTPAGNVSVFASGATLFIRGDDLSNEVRITGAGNGSLDVAGVDTTVNELNETLQFTGIRNVDIKMFDGDDTATFVNAHIDGLLRYIGGDGNDQLLFGEFNNGENYFGSVRAVMGAGNDTVRTNGEDKFTALKSFTSLNGEGNNTTDLDPQVELVLGVVRIISGNGDDFVDLGDIKVTTGSVTVKSGAGNNFFFLDGDVTVNGDFRVTGGAGNDQFNPGDTGGLQMTVHGSLVASLGDGINEIDFETKNLDITGSLSVVGGEDADSVDFDADTIDVRSISLRLGAGDNHATLDRGATTIHRSLTINTLGGEDNVILFGLDVFGLTLISTGEGLDEIFVDNSRFRGFFTLLTGGGSDTVRVENGNHDDGIGTQFHRSVLVNLGAGADTISVGFDADDFVTAISHVTLNGGADADALTPSGFDIFGFAPQVISFP